MSCRTRARWAVLAIAVLSAACAKRDAVPADTAEAGAGLQPEADARLRAMSTALASAQTFSFSTSQRHERVNAAGEKVAHEFSSDYVVARPNRFWMKRTRDGANSFGIYDGSTLSLQGDAEKVWARVDMPPTLDEALDYAAEVYRLPMPVADLAYADPYASIVGENTAGRIAGKETIDGAVCDHLVIETPTVDAEVWLEEGEHALPRKLELVYKELEGAPRSSITFSNWNLEPQVDAELFAFVPPADYHLIPMVAVLSPEEEALVRAAKSGGEPAQSEPAAGSGN